MTVPTLNSVAEFSTNGVTTNFPFFFKFLANEDLVVTYVSPAGVSTVLTFGLQYTVNGAGDEDGGSVVTTTALAGPGQLIVSREMDAYQQTSLRNQGKFLAETHEDVFDRLTMLIQQGFSIFKRALVRPFGRDYYDAESRRIANVANPVEQQDAATRGWSEQFIADLLETGQGPINNAANVIYSYPDGTIHTVQSLSSSTGAKGLGYKGSNVYDYLERFTNQVMFPAQFEIKTLEQGATSATATAAAWDTMRLAAEAAKATVVVPQGTYELPPGVRMDADNTTWLHMPGSLIKLWSTQSVGTDFLTYDTPNNQRVERLRFDANRAQQNAATFGIDKSGCIVINPVNSTFIDTEVVSSPSKGFVVVPRVGESLNSIRIDGVTGGNCVNQAFLLDANNMTTTWLGQNYVGRIRVGETSHAGFACNDGVHNVVFGPIDCDVNNSVWDAISVRDCWDLKFSTMVGKRGRNGIQFFSLNVLCRDIVFGEAIGENNAQSGVAILAGKNITGATAGGKNNGIIGLNIGQRAVAGVTTTSKNITIANPIGYDDRAVPVQQYGLFVGGADNVHFGSAGMQYGNVTRNVSIPRGAPSTNVHYPKVERVSDQPFTVVSGGSQDVVCALPVSFEDLLYDIETEVDSISAGLSVQANIRAKSTGSVTVHVFSLTGSAGSGTVSIKCTRRP